MGETKILDQNNDALLEENKELRFKIQEIKDKIQPVSKQAKIYLDWTTENLLTSKQMYLTLR